MATASRSERTWTADSVRALPDDGNRYECVDGELLVTPSPRLSHQRAVLELSVTLRPYVSEHQLGSLFLSPADVALDDRSLVQPDVFVAGNVAGRRPREWTDLRSLVLAVEIVSPSSARADRGVKRRLYQRWHTDEYWVVDLDARIIERWRPSDDRPEVIDSVLRWPAREGVAPLEISLDQYFARVLDED